MLKLAMQPTNVLGLHAKKKKSTKGARLTHTNKSYTQK